MSDVLLPDEEVVWGCNIRTGKTLDGKILEINDDRAKEILDIIESKLNDKEAFMFGCFLKAISEGLIK